LQLVSQKMHKAVKKYIKTTLFISIKNKTDLYYAFRYKAAITIQLLNIIRTNRIERTISNIFDTNNVAFFCGVFESCDTEWIEIMHKNGMTIEPNKMQMAVICSMLGNIIANGSFLKVYSILCKYITNFSLTKKIYCATVLSDSLIYGKTDVVKYIFDNEYQFEPPYDFSLAETIRNGHFETFRYFIDYITSKFGYNHEHEFCIRIRWSGYTINFDFFFTLACRYRRQPQFIPYLKSFLLRSHISSRCKNCSVFIDEHH